MPLVLELSTVFLHLRPLKSQIIDALFAVSFIGVRDIFFVYQWVIYFVESPSSQMFESYSDYIIFVFGLVFTGLNLYWSTIVVGKVHKKLKAMMDTQKPKPH